MAYLFPRQFVERGDRLFDIDARLYRKQLAVAEATGAVRAPMNSLARHTRHSQIEHALLSEHFSPLRDAIRERGLDSAHLVAGLAGDRPACPNHPHRASSARGVIQS